MAKKYTCPPQRPSGAGTFSNNLVGFQVVAGGGLTQGNFDFNYSSTEKVNRNFVLGTFSEPITLESLSIQSLNESALIFQNNFKVYPNFDLLDVTNFTLYGSLTKRISSSITRIISYFPAALEFNRFSPTLVVGNTIENISFDETTNISTLDLQLSRLRNPFGIDFSSNATNNLKRLEIPVSDLRNFTLKYTKYSLYYNGIEYPISNFISTNNTTIGYLRVFVIGKPFTGQTSDADFVIRPNDQIVAQEFNFKLDEVEKFLLNRNSSPIYTSSFLFPKENDDGTYYTEKINLTWPLSGLWNLDISSIAFEAYLTSLNEITEAFDSYKTNLISRFLTTPAFKEFDTVDQKMEKILQIYGRSFDETKKYITALSYMTSVNYNVGNDIPSQLLKNLAQTLGWQTNISPITSTNFLDSIFGGTNNQQSMYSGVSVRPTPDELNYQFFRNLILNTAYLYKSKGTRRAIENILKLIGAPEALTDFNEYVYLADQKINIDQFNTQWAQISGGTYIDVQPTLEVANTFTIMGYRYTGFTITSTTVSVEIDLDEYPIDEEGYPRAPITTNNYFFQVGSGWFESTPSHRAPEKITNNLNTTTGNTQPSYQTQLLPYTYGQIYLDRFRKLPYTRLGFALTPIVDNNKSWTTSETGVRVNLDGSFNAKYIVDTDKLVLNVKNIDLFMNPAQGLVYDVWFMSREYDYPIPNRGLNYIAPTTCVPNPIPIYPSRGGIDWTEINPQPKRKTFFEFAQTFWINMINVRNRMFSTNGKTGGYPTLESIWWRYLESEEQAGIKNNNFKYQNMIEFVNGLGDYWIRVVEQFVPATTLWNTGTRYENSIFHRQKFAWKRQIGCQTLPFVPQINDPVEDPPFDTDTIIRGRIPPTCRPCLISTNIFSYDCPIEATTCPLYPWIGKKYISDFQGTLGQTLNSYAITNGIDLNGCSLDTMTTDWYVDIKLNSTTIQQFLFFNGVGFSNPYYSSPSTTNWENALNIALLSLRDYGYDFYFTDDLQIVIFNELCVNVSTNTNVEINVGINFNLICG